MGAFRFRNKQNTPCGHNRLPQRWRYKYWGERGERNILETDCSRSHITFTMVYACPVLLLLLLWPRPSLLAASPRTYEDTDRLTGERVQCERCPPGSFLRAGCSSERRSECARCPEGSYTEMWNHISKCLRCGACGRNQVVKQACTAESDCQCECKQGYYYEPDYDSCVRHRECPVGQGALTKGTPENNTVCQICSGSTFSNTSSAHQSCMEHKKCSESGLKMVLRGSSWHDSVCADCTQLKDAADYLRETIPDFVVYHNMNVKRLRRVVHRLFPEDLEKSRRTSGLSSSELHAEINAWAASATPAQIRQLPDLLKNRAGDWLKNMLDHIETRLTEECGLGNGTEGN
ncbi:tumor necrosis factor receptor superfamily member 6B [Menidia menidia]